MTPKLKEQAQAYSDLVLTISEITSVRHRVAQWPDAQKILEHAMLQHRQQLQEQPTLRNSMKRYRTLLDTLKLDGRQSFTEREASYLAALRVGERILSAIGFPGAVDEASAIITQRTVSAEANGCLQRTDLQLMLNRFREVLPAEWRCQIMLRASADTDDSTVYFKDLPGMNGEPYKGDGVVWDGGTRILTVEHKMAVQLADDVTRVGVMRVVIGMLLPVMLAGTAPVATVAQALQFTVALAEALGAKAPVPEASAIVPSMLEKKPPPDLYRGAAQQVFVMLWRDAMSFGTLLTRTKLEESRLQNILRMFRTDETRHKWRLRIDRALYSIVAT